MKLVVFAVRRPFTTLMLVVALAGGGAVGVSKLRADFFHEQSEQPDQSHRKIVLTSPKAMDVTVTQRYICRIHAQRHISVRVLENGHLAEIKVRNGQAVKKGDVMFKLVTASARAKADLAKAESDFTSVIAPFDGIVGPLHRSWPAS